MVIGMALIGAGILWTTRIPAHGNFWQDLAGPFFVAGIGVALAFIPVSIGALTGVTEGDAGVASGLISTSQQLGGAIGVAVASSVAASRFHTLVHRGLWRRSCPHRRLHLCPEGLRPDRACGHPGGARADPSLQDGQVGGEHPATRPRRFESRTLSWMASWGE